jgi:glycogen synthase
LGLCALKKSYNEKKLPRPPKESWNGGKETGGILEIVILTNEYPPHIYGGAGVHVKYLSRELARLEDRRHELRILCFGEQKENAGRFSVEGVRERRDFPFQDPRHEKFLETLFRNLFMTGSVKRAEIIHCHTWYTYLAGCLMKQILGAPLVITTHSLEPHRPWKEEQLGSAYRATAWLEKTAYENADGVIAVSGSMKQGVQALYRVPPEKVRVIPNGIDGEEYKPTFDPSILRRYHIDPDKPFLLFVGRITRQKGVVHLLQAIPRLLPSIQVVLCAGAPDTEEIGREISQRVAEVRAKTGNEILLIEQWVPREDLIVLLSHASVFICPSIYEPFGIINLEAMACGTPVVATAVGGIPEAVIHGQTGFLVSFDPRSTEDFEPRDPERLAGDLAEAVNRLFQSPEEAKRMGLEARQRVEKYFSWTEIARQTLDFYHDLEGNRRRRIPVSGG